MSSGMHKQLSLNIPGGIAAESGDMIRIVAPHFVAGVVIGERAAPIVAYMTQWPVESIKAYCADKGWGCERIATGGRP